MKAKSWLVLLLVSSLSILFTVLSANEIGLLTYGHPTFQDWGDHQKYLYMAKNPGGFFIAPYCWRIALPWLASHLPFDLQLGFMSIAFISFSIVGVNLYLISRSFGFNVPLSVCSLALFYSMRAPKFALFDFWLPDAFSFAIITLSILLLNKKELILYSLLIAIGVLVKETVLFTLPLAYTLSASRWLDWRAARRTILAALPACLVLITLRLLISPRNGDFTYLASLDPSLSYGFGADFSYNYFHALTLVLSDRLSNLTFFSLYDYILAPLGITAVIPCLTGCENRILFMKFSPFFLAVFSQVLIAVNTDRLLALAFPATILLSLNALKTMSNK